MFVRWTGLIAIDGEFRSTIGLWSWLTSTSVMAATGASLVVLPVAPPPPHAASNRASTAPAIAKVLRRGFDVTCAMLLLFLLAPLFAVIALLIKLNNGGPVFYLQPRVGKNFKIFSVLKFRTMVRGADQKGQFYR